MPEDENESHLWRFLAIYRAMEAVLGSIFVTTHGQRYERATARRVHRLPA